MKTYWLLPLVLVAGCAMEAEPMGDSDGSIVVEPDPCETWDEVQECTTDAGTAGAQRCEHDPDRDYELYYTSCGDTSECSPGDVKSCGLDGEFLNLSMGCSLLPDGSWGWDPMACNTPLVLSFDDSPVEFTQASGGFDLGGSFDLVGSGTPASHDWVSSATPWLTLDRNGNGSVDDGKELFGSMTRLDNGERAQHGFAALTDLDENADGQISAADSLFEDLRLWRDSNQNRNSEPAELSSLSEAGIRSLSLSYGSKRRCTETACEIERARFTFTDSDGNQRSGTTIDVHFGLY